MKSLVVVIAGIIVPLTVPTETAMAETVTTEESAVIVAMPAAEETPVAAETVTVDNTELPGADMLQNQINTMMQDTASWVDSIPVRRQLMAICNYLGYRAQQNLMI